MERPIGKMIRVARIARGLNQQVLADLAGVATRTLSSVKSGQAGMGMTVDTLVRLADALELDAGDVLNGAIGREMHAAPRARERRQLRREAVGGSSARAEHPMVRRNSECPRGPFGGWLNYPAPRAGHRFLPAVDGAY